MRQLSALDALFLQLETPETPTHVGSIAIYDRPRGFRGASFYKPFRAHIASRMHIAPVFTHRLAFIPLDLASPLWLQAGEIDLDYHVQHLILPKPGTMAQLETAVAKLHEGMMDRDQPLWQFWLIEGMKTGQFALYSKIHHAALDGQGGVAVAQALLDTDPKAHRKVAPDMKQEPRLPPTAARLLGQALRHTIGQYRDIVKAMPEAVKAAGKFLSSSEAKEVGAPSEQGTGIVAGLIKKGQSLEQTARALIKKLPGGVTLGPRTPLNVAIGKKRVFVATRISLAESRAIAKHFDVKLNDVMLATVAGAVRRHFAHDKAALARSMIGAVPASLRAPGENTQGNVVTMMLVSLATNVKDPKKRLAAIAAASARAKALVGAGGLKSLIPTDLPSLGLPWLMSVIPPLYRKAVASNKIPILANIAISNVPGPQVPLYLAGAEMKEYYPVSIVTHGLALNITILSYNGSLDCGLVACKKSVPNLRAFAAHMQDAHRELLALSRESSIQPAPPVQD